MTVEMSLLSSPVSAAPGTEVPWALELRNPGPATRVRLSATGRGAGWVDIPELAWLEPGERRVLELLVRPPASAGPVGAVVQVVLRIDFDDFPPLTRAGVIVLAARVSVDARFEQPNPVIVRSTTLPVALRGEGTESVAVALHTTSTAKSSVSPESVVVDPGGVARAVVHATAPLLWWGAPRSIDVSLEWTAGDAASGKATTSLSQRAVLQRGTTVGVILTLAVAVLAYVVVLGMGR